MPKNSKKGKNTKNKGGAAEEEQRIILKDPSTEEYAIVLKKCGSGRFMLKMNESEDEVIGRLCGKFRRGRNKHNNWVDIDTVVLVGKRDWENRGTSKKQVVDIVMVYNQQEARKLRKMGEFTEESRRPEKETEEEDADCAFDFDDI